MNQIKSSHLLISKAKLNHKQKIQYHNLIKKLILQFNHENSSSLSKRNYQRIICSIDYICLQSFLLHHNYQDSIQNIFNEGLSVLEIKKDEALTKYQKLVQDSYLYRLSQYNKILQQLHEYLYVLNTPFRIFRYAFVHHDLDYPLLDGLPLYHDMYHKKGLDLVHEYMDRLILENQFIHYFEHELDDFYDQFEHFMQCSYSDLQINLCETMLIQFAGNYFINQKLSILFEDEIDSSLLNHLDFVKKTDEFYRTIQQIFPLDIVHYLSKNKNQLILKFTQMKNNPNAFLINSQRSKVNVILQDDHTFSSFEKFLDEFSHSDCRVQLLLQSSLNIYEISEIFQNELTHEEKINYLQDIPLSQLALLIQSNYPELFIFHQQFSLNIHEFDHNDEFSAALQITLEAKNKYQIKQLEYLLNHLEIKK